MRGLHSLHFEGNMANQMFRTFSLDNVLNFEENFNFPEDVSIFQRAVNEKIQCHVYYDMVMEIFIMKLFKVVEHITTGIGLRVVAVERLLKLFARIYAIRERYDVKDMILSYRYEIDTDVFVTIGKLKFICFPYILYKYYLTPLLSLK